MAVSKELALLNSYLDVLKTLTTLPPQALDFVAAYAERAVFIKLKMREMGYKPVCHGSWWSVEKLKEGEGWS